MQESPFSTYRPSWWEIDSFWSGIDVVIVGAGLVGLSTALSLKKQHAKLRVVVLERAPHPLGASTRNAGFACFGSPTELLDDLQHRTEEEVWTLVRRRWQGLRLLRRTLGDTAIGYRDLGGYETFTRQEEAAYAASSEALPEFNRRLREITGLPNVYRAADARIDRFGLHNVTHLIHNSGEGQLDTGKLMRTLWSSCQEVGVECYTGLTVTAWTETGGAVELTTQAGWTLQTNRMVIATNALARTLLPDIPDIRPVRNQVLITEPVQRLLLRGSFHYDRGYFYFRNVGSRILVGGGRHLAGTAAETDRFGLAAPVQERLENLLHEVIAPGRTVKIAHRWSGLLGVGQSKQPVIVPVGERTVAAVRMGGMGIAIGMWVGERAAELVSQL